MKRTQCKEKGEIVGLILKYILYFFGFYILSKANINGIIQPFSFGLIFGLMWCGNNVLILAPSYVVANFLGGFSLSALYNALGVAIIILIAYGIHYKFRKRMVYWQIGIYGILSQIVTVTFSILEGGNPIFIVISLILGELFMFACIKIFEAIKVKGFAYKFSLDEIICAGILLMAISSGLGEFQLGDFSLIKLFGAILILLSSNVFSSQIALFSAGIMGLGVFLNSSSPILLSAFILWALAVSCFRGRNKIFSAFALLLIEAGLGWFFNLYYSYSIISYLPVIIGTLIFMVIPQKFLNELSGFFNWELEGATIRNLANRNNECVARKLGELSEIFAEMDNSFRGLIKGGLSKEQAKEMLCGDLKMKVCENCPDKNKCHRVYADETRKVFLNMVDAGFERGKATLIDVPPFLTSRCNHVNVIISTINETSAQYKQYASLMTNFDSSRILVADQLQGISKIMRSLAFDIKKPISFDSWKEKKITESLAYSNITCSDVVVYDQGESEMFVSLVVKNEEIDHDKIADILSKVCAGKLSFDGEGNSGRSGWTTLTFKTSPAYNIVFGTATTKKATSKVSGDSYSLIKIDNDKFMMALCDGMGSGKKAEKTSNLAMGIIENFYKAGFDNEIILSSANKLLSLSNDEMFSALDLAIVDLRKGVADLIKLGAPVGLVKHKSSTDLIEGSALPLGIIDNVQPNIKKLVLNSGDYIILATDGITDSFVSNEDYINFVNNLTESNPQNMSEEILKKALENCGGSAVDDMTIIISKIFKN